MFVTARFTSPEGVGKARRGCQTRPQPVHRALDGGEVPDSRTGESKRRVPEEVPEDDRTEDDRTEDHRAENHHAGNHAAGGER